MGRFLIPLAGFVVLAIFLGVGLTLNPREVPSPLIDKPAPEFSLPQLHEPEKAIAKADMHGQVWLLNVWASWCVACRQEHPFLVELAKRNVLPIVGLNYKDQPPDAKRWLNQFGNPYNLSADDRDGRVGIDWGVYGVPETFLVDKKGTIRMKHIGPLTPEVIEKDLLPLVQQLQQEAA
jgi:cytochrome c biogenesis protein CcmG/thiol:disulfide interchange protein DsbE